MEDDLRLEICKIFGINISGAQINYENLENQNKHCQCLSLSWLTEPSTTLTKLGNAQPQHVFVSSQPVLIGRYWLVIIQLITKLIKWIMYFSKIYITLKYISFFLAKARVKVLAGRQCTI